MPNWCTNVVSIDCTNESILRAIAKAFNKGTLLTSLLNDSEETDPKLKTLWRFKNWGTCLDITPSYENDAEVYRFKAEVDSWSLDLNFDSAWTPPLQMYSLLSKTEGVTVKGYFYETVKGYCGRFVNGEDTFYPIDKLDSKWTSENVPPDIDSALGITERLVEWEDYEFELKEDEIVISDSLFKSARS